jgi:hypothetical protein
MPNRNPSFEDVSSRVHARGSVRVASTRDTAHIVTAEVSKGQKVLIAKARRRHALRHHGRALEG